MSEIRCDCGSSVFKIWYVENYCEAGECFRLFCVSCGKEQDWHAKGNMQGLRESEKEANQK